MKYSKILIPVLLLIAAGYICVRALSPAHPLPRVVNGVLDLRERDWSQEGPLTLKGGWVFHDQVFVRTEEQGRVPYPDTGRIVAVPKAWNDLHEKNGRDEPGFGYGSYSLTILLGPERPRLGFLFLDQSSAFKAFLNGLEVFSSGKPGPSKENYLPSYATGLVDYHPDSDRLNLTMWVSNFHHWQGGAWEPVVVGEYGRMKRNWWREHLIAYLVFGALVIIGLYHLALARIVLRNRAALWLGAVCLLIAVRVLTTGIRPIYQLIPGADWGVLLRLVYVCLYLAIPVSFLYFRSLFPQEVHRGFVIAFAELSGVFTLSALFLPAEVYTRGMPVYQIIILGSLLYAFWCMILALVRKREGSALVLFSFAVMFVATLNDILFSRDLIQSVYLAQFGVLIFSFTQTVIIARRFNKAFTTIADQRTELASSYTTIRESEERFQSLLRSMSDVVWFALADGSRVQYINGAAEEIYGKPLNLIMKTPDFWLEAVHPEDRPEVMQKILDMDNRGQVEMEYRIVRPDGREAWLFERRFLVYDGNGRVVRVGSIASDITARKADEAECRKLEDQLRQAQKMEAVGTLAGGIAHDFNNILGAIMGFGELAHMEIRKWGWKSSHLERIIDSADRGRRLVEQILAFSRKSSSDPSPLDLNELVTGTVKVLEHAIPKMIHIRTRLAEDLESVMADATQLEQVIMNLANNACDAMPDGGKLIFKTGSVTLDQDSGMEELENLQGRYVKLTVTDTGHGMDQETLKHIFDPFFTTKEIGRGTGLGLSTAYGIVKDNGGRITCYSEKGLGTTFRIYLPALKEKAVPAPRCSLPAEAPGGSETILLVDDEEAIRDLAGEILRGMGYQVLTSGSGEEALEIYRDRGPKVDLIILDLGMPGMGGFRCLKELLALDREARVLIASGYSAEGAIKDTLEKGASGYIAKPFRRKDLLEKVRGIIDAAPPGRDRAGQ